MIKNFKYIGSPDEDKDIMNRITKSFGDELVDKFTQKKTFSPSTIVFGHGSCPRYWWYAFSGEQWKETRSHVAMARMNTGTFRHEKLQDDLLKEFGDKIVIEQNLRMEDPPVNSYCDAVVHHGDRVIPLEIKTVGDMAFSYRKTTGKPAAYNLMQILIYMYILDADMGILLYEHRDTFEKVMIPVRMTEEYLEYIEYMLNWMRDTYAAYDSSEKPKYFKNRRSNSKICQTCPVKETCDADGNDGIIDLPLLRSIDK